MSRDNAAWMAELKGSGSQRDSALRDLRILLLRNLRKAMSDRPAADDSFLEDVVQDSLLRILDRLDQFAGRSQFSTWATSIAIRVALTELRRRRWRDVSMDEVLQDTEFGPVRAIDENLEPEARFERTAILKMMYQIIQDQLTEKQRTALLAELKGMPQEEIARQLGMNRNALYKLTHDARKKLKQGMEAAGFEAHDILTALAK